MGENNVPNDGVVSAVNPTEPDKTHHPAGVVSSNRFFDQSIKRTDGNIHSKNAPNALLTHRGLFTQTAEDILLHLTEISPSVDNDFHPILSECFNILSSVEFNKGVYYEDADVAPIFSVVARRLFLNPQFKEKVAATMRAKKNDEYIRAYGIEPGKSSTPLTIAELVREYVRELSSIDNEVSIGVIREDSNWLTVDQENILRPDGNMSDVIELIRQDNPDKWGPKKYRIRKTSYTKERDDIHEVATVGQRFKSHWYKEPNYWSHALRDGIKGIAHDVSDIVAAKRASVVFVSEGGIFKGTATADTDLDTYCYVFCKSRGDFEEIGEIIQTAYRRNIQELPFAVQEGQALRFVYYDEATGETYLKDESNSFKRQEVDYLRIKDPIPFDIRGDEKGVYIVKGQNEVIYSKPEEYHNTHVGIAISVDRLAIDFSNKSFKPPYTRGPQPRPIQIDLT